MTGATGRLGGAVVPKLAEAGYEVRAMSRAPRSGGGATWVVADLTTGRGLAEALDGAGAVIHLASAPYKGKYTERVEVEGTRRLCEAAREAGVGHLLYTSIIGADRVPWGYFGTKVRTEEVVRAGGVPWSVVRAAQFHAFVDQAFGLVARAGLLVVDPAVKAQPVDVRDVADRLVRRLGEGPSGRAEDFGGPEVVTMEEAARQWLAARRVRRPVVRVRLPGRLGVAFRGGHLTTRATPAGAITWSRYLQEHPRA
ncbi:NAD(P)H-binding protein [Nonomuraea rhodomycinica]|uniref:NAD(P)H-binding protein n=1 Tax=Nonomuraea rhodomycinica TaxID=1712872 RepID=A0A7Y6IPE6_9ACTN|nr:NAD(P)H-binding protein [Nonomuraea rhodomycinica]